MSLKTTDAILAPSRLSEGILTGVVDKLDRPDAKDLFFIERLVTWCGVAGVDDGLALAQWLHETANGTSVRWNNDLNPGGVGIPADSTVQPFRIADADEAARIFVNCLYALVKKQAHPRVPVPANAQDWFTRVWLAKVNHPNFPTVRTVADLNTRYAANNDQHATWAWDDQYPAKLVSRAKTFMPNLPDQGSSQPGGSDVSLTFGKVPMPGYHDRPIYKTPGVGMDNLGKRDVIGVTWHRILGSLNGTDGYFRNPSVGALTDFGMGVKATDGAALSCVLYRWNDPLGFQSGWASGRVIAPWGDGAKFVAKYGVNAVNKRRASLEISGQYNTPLTLEEQQEIAAWTAYWADQDGIPWDVFPIRPEDGFSFVCWHQEFTGPQEKICPGGVVMEATDDIFEMIKVILKRYQTGAYTEPETPDGTVYAAPITYPWLAKEAAAAGVDRMIGRTRVYYVPQVYEAIRETPRKQATGKNTKEIGPPIEPGTKFHADFCYRSAGTSYVLTPYGTRVRAADLLPKIQISAKGTVSVRRTSGADPEIARKADAA